MTDGSAPSVAGLYRYDEHKERYVLDDPAERRAAYHLREGRKAIQEVLEGNDRGSGADINMIGNAYVRASMLQDDMEHIVENMESEKSEQDPEDVFEGQSAVKGPEFIRDPIGWFCARFTDGPSQEDSDG